MCICTVKAENCCVHFFFAAVFTSPSPVVPHHIKHLVADEDACLLSALIIECVWYGLHFYDLTPAKKYHLQCIYKVSNKLKALVKIDIIRHVKLLINGID